MNKRMSITIFFMILIAVVFINSTSRYFSTKPENNVKIYSLIHTVSPKLLFNSRDFKWSDTLTATICFWKGQTLYSAFHYSNTLDDSGNIIERNKRAFIFVTLKDSSYGYYYENKKRTKINVDTFLKYEWYAQIKIYDIFKDANYKLLSSGRDSSGLFTETYSLKGRDTDISKTGSMQLWYSTDIKDNSFSLSKELDSINSMKLVRQKVINDARELPGYNIKLPRIVTSYELEEIKELKDTTLVGYFKGYHK